MRLVHEIDLLAAALPAAVSRSTRCISAAARRRRSAPRRSRVMAALRAGFGFRDDARTLGRARSAHARRRRGRRSAAPASTARASACRIFEVVARSARILRDAGIEKINCDLMYGLPRQSATDVECTTRSVAALRPQRIAVFGYAHVPWLKKHQRLIQAAELPDADERLAQAEMAREILVSLGYEPVGLDHFALPGDELAAAAKAGRLRRNFQGYTVDDADALLGLGASAIGRLPQGYVQNTPDNATYARAVQAGRFATAKGIQLSDDDRTRAAIIERLMCDLAVDLAAAKGSGPGSFAAELDELTPIEAEGFVRIDGTRIRVTEKGRPFVRLVASAFDRRLREGQGRHARAV
jgi:oxygen-independent coproporphyrinogen III oxidase